MLAISPLTLASTAAAFGLAAALAHVLWQERLRRESYAVERAAWQDLVRITRLTAGDLRGLALSLLGQAQNAAEPQRAFLLGTEAVLLDLTEALVRGSDDPSQSIILRQESIGLATVVEFVVGRVASQLGPGRRDWRVSAGLRDIELRADRRALHQILLRVLSSAALATGEGDCIEISAQITQEGCMIVVQDEGAGLAVTKVRGPGRETRGLGVGLALAHGLVQAHGGTLTIDSTAGVGSRARLFFPATE